MGREQDTETAAHVRCRQRANSSVAGATDRQLPMKDAISLDLKGVTFKNKSGGGIVFRYCPAIDTAPLERRGGWTAVGKRGRGG